MITRKDIFCNIENISTKDLWRLLKKYSKEDDFMYSRVFVELVKRGEI